MPTFGPLEGLKVIELAGLAPAPFAGMILSDYGADVVRVDRPATGSSSRSITADSLTRGKRSIALDLKNPADRATLLEMVRRADVLIEGYRPGVMESLNLGPRDLQQVNRRLVYARLTGFPRSSDTWAKAAGHDINYVALSGALHALGTEERPMPPANLLGDFAGGGMTCVLGILLALHRRDKRDGRESIGDDQNDEDDQGERGAVVEANMVDGASYLSTFIRHAQAVPEMWGHPRGRNLLDGGAPFYGCYATRDGKFVALGALEPHFYKTFLSRFGLSEEEAESCSDRGRDNWDAMRDIFTRRFRQLTRAEWCAIYDGTDACVTPVLEEIMPAKVPVLVDGYEGLTDSVTHIKGREKFGMKPGQHQKDVLQTWGLSKL